MTISKVFNKQNTQINTFKTATEPKNICHFDGQINDKESDKAPLLNTFL